MKYNDKSTTFGQLSREELSLVSRNYDFYFKLESLNNDNYYYTSKYMLDAREIIAIFKSQKVRVS